MMRMRPALGAPSFYGGAAFDTWDNTGTRAADVDRFTADVNGTRILTPFRHLNLDPRWSC